MKRIYVICSITVLFLAFFGFLTKAYGEDTQSYEGGVYDYTIIDDGEEYTVYLSYFSTDLPSVSIYCLKPNAILQTHAVHGDNLTELRVNGDFYKIEEGSFALCQNLENILNSNAYEGILYEKIWNYSTSGWAYSLFTYPRGKKSETFRIPETVNSLNITKISSEAFYGCKNLKTIALPNSITYIYNNAFYGCDNLEHVIVENDTPFEISSSTFPNRSSITLHVPEGAKTKYEAANFWSEFKDIVEVKQHNEGTSFTAKTTEGITMTFTVLSNSDLTCSVGRTSLNNHSPAIDYSYYGPITIPETVDGYTVTKIDQNAFQGCNINNISIPNTITSIGSYAFSGCDDLSSITIPTSVTCIGLYAFNGCTSLTAFHLPANVVEIGTYVLAGCNSLESVTVDEDNSKFDSRNNCNAIIETESNKLYAGCKNSMITNGITEIKDGAFYGISLNTTNLPETIVEIGKSAFAYSSFDNLRIPKSVTYLGYNAFYEATIDSLLIPYAESKINYSTYKVSGDNYAPFLNTTIRSARIEREFEYVYNGSTPIAPFRRATIDNLYIGNNSISWLYEGSKITNLYFEDGITTIPSYALNNGTYANQFRSTVKNIYLPEGVETISNKAFYYLGTEKIKLPSTLKTIGSYAFASCYLDGEIIFPEGLESIGEKAFYDGNVGLSQITCLANNPIDISENVFSSTTYTQTLKVPYGSQSLYAAATGWKNFTNIVEMAPPSPAITFANANVKAICLQNWDTDGDGELSEAEAAAVTDLGKVFMSNKNFTSFDELQYFTGLTSIADSAFYNCTGMTSVAIPNTVTTIGKRAFKSCSGLTSVTIPESVTSIGYASFHNCDNLTSLTIPNSVTSIGVAAFATCNKLTSIIVENGNNSFISEDGVLFNKNKTSLICFPAGKTQSTYIIPESVTKISSYAFDSCNKLTSVDIPNSVTSIGEWVFSACSGLTSVTIPNSVTSIGNHAFWRCYSMTSVTIPNSVTTIGSGAFGYCSALTSVKVGMESPLTIDSETFTNRANTTLYLPKGCKSAYQAANYWSEFKAIKEFPDSDVNQDGEIDMMDVVDIARFVVGTPAETFVEFLADLNNNSEVNVADAVVLVNEIVGDQNFAKAFGAPRQDQGDDRLTLTKNDDHSLSFSMESQRDYTAFQFDLYTNSEDDVMGIRLNTARKHGHQLIYNKVDEGHYRVVALSVANHTFNGNNGELLNIQLDGFNATDMTISSIHFITTDGTDYRFDDLSLSNATGIESLTPNPSPKKEGNVYDLSGRKVSESSVLPKGVYIMNGKKVIVK